MSRGATDIPPSPPLPHAPPGGRTEQADLFRPFSGTAHLARCPLVSCFPAGQSCAKVHAAEAWTCCCPLTTVEDTYSQPSVYEFLFLFFVFLLAMFVFLLALFVCLLICPFSGCRWAPQPYIQMRGHSHCSTVCCESRNAPGLGHLAFIPSTFTCSLMLSGSVC